MSDQVNKIIAGIPTDEMLDGYRQQRDSLQKNLALNAAAYRMQESNALLKGEARKVELGKIETVIIQLSASIDDIDKRMNGASEALKS